MSETDQKSFDTIVQKEGSFTFVAIPFSPREAWGAKPRYSVAGTINGIPVRGTLGALGQDYFLRLEQHGCATAGLHLGQMLQCASHWKVRKKTTLRQILRKH